MKNILFIIFIIFITPIVFSSSYLDYLTYSKLNGEQSFDNADWFIDTLRVDNLTAIDTSLENATIINYNVTGGMDVHGNATFYDWIYGIYSDITFIHSSMVNSSSIFVDDIYESQEGGNIQTNDLLYINSNITIPECMFGISGDCYTLEQLNSSYVDDDSAYWESDGTDSATGNWDISPYNFTATNEIKSRYFRFGNTLSPALDGGIYFNSSSFNYYITAGILGGVISGFTYIYGVNQLSGISLVESTSVRANTVYTSGKLEVDTIQAYSNTGQNITFFNGSGTGYANLRAKSFVELTPVDMDYDGEYSKRLPTPQDVLGDDGKLSREHMFDDEREDDNIAIKVPIVENVTEETCFEDNATRQTICRYYTVEQVTGYKTVHENGTGVGKVAVNNRKLLTELYQEIQELKSRIAELEKK